MSSSGLIRSRWAAIGAAVAVTLGGGGLIGVSAASGDASSLTTVTPTRIMDTRQGSGVKVSGQTVALQVTGEITTYASDGTSPAETVVPAGANAVSLNLTVTQGERNQGYGYVTAFPCAAATDRVPNVSTLNFVEGVDVANSTVVPLGETGKICLNVYGSAHLIVDANGYYATAASGAGSVDAYTKAESDAIEAELEALIDGKADSGTSYTKAQVDAKLTTINDERMERAPLITTHSGTSAVAVNVKYHSGCTSGSDIDGGGTGHQLWFYPQVVEKGTSTELAVCNNPVQGSTFKIPLDVMTSNGAGLDNASVASLKQTYAPYQYTICFEYAGILEIDTVRIQATDEDPTFFSVGSLSPPTDGCRTATFTRDDLGNMLDRLVSEPNEFGLVDLNTPVAWNLYIVVKEDGVPVADDPYHLYLEGVKVYWDSLEEIQEYVDN